MKCVFRFHYHLLVFLLVFKALFHRDFILKHLHTEHYYTVYKHYTLVNNITKTGSIYHAGIPILKYTIAEITLAKAVFILIP